MATVLVVLTVLLAPTVRAWFHQRSQINALRAQVASQQRQVAALGREQDRWGDDAYVIQQARERLKFVKVGDKSYNLIDGGSSGSAGPVGTGGAREAWYSRLGASVRAADRGVDAPAGGSTSP